MKHDRYSLWEEALKARAPRHVSDRRAKRLQLTQQSTASWVIAFFCLLMVVATVVDAPMRTLALTLDPNLARVLGVITGIGNGAWPILGSLGVILGVRVLAPSLTWRDGIALRRVAQIAGFLLQAVLVSGIVANVFKTGIGRARPMTDIGSVLNLHPFAFEPGWASFPSGHSTTAIAAALVLSMIWPRHSVAFVSVGLFAALTRAFIGMHWMSDVCAGLALGTVVTLVLRAGFDGKKRRPMLSPRLARHFQGMVQRGVGIGEGWFSQRIKAVIQR